MLLAAVDAVKEGGVVVYSTCALSPTENDGVVSKILKRRAGKVTVKCPSAALLALTDTEGGVFVDTFDFDSTEHGIHVLPDKSGWGPLYFSIISKTAP